MFDAGARTMVRAVAMAGAKLGGIKRVVLGHGHTDHRGSAPWLGVPVLCHADEVMDAEGSGGWRYWNPALPGLPTPQRQIHRALHRLVWDGGPVKIAETVAEGEEVAGFSVVHIPGHAPGQIALWRESDRLALSTDCFYTLEMWGRDCPPRVPEETYNYDTEQALPEHPQARRPGAGGGLAGPREACDWRRARAAGTRRCRALSSREPTRPAAREARGRRTGAASREAEGPEQRLQRRGRQRADTARLADAGAAGASMRRRSPAMRSSREDAWHSAVEFLFERLAVRWEIAGAPIERQRELLARFRVATPDGASVGARGAARALRGALPGGAAP